MTSTVFTEEKRKIIQDLQESGFASSHVYYLLEDEKINLFENNKLFFDRMHDDPQIKDRIARIKSGNPIQDKNKPFEINQYDFLSRSLGLNDASFIELYLCDDFLDIAESYLGQTPVIRNVLTWMHPGNPLVTRTHSQNWHRDQEDDHNLRIWIYYSDIGPDNGAIEYVKYSSLGMKNNFIAPNIKDGIFSPHGYLNRDQVSKIPPHDIVQGCGPVGSIFFVDTNGIHRGGFASSGVRTKSMACYLKPQAYQITNGPLYTFNYNSQKVNYCDYESKDFKTLTERQKKCLK